MSKLLLKQISELESLLESGKKSNDLMLQKLETIRNEIQTKERRNVVFDDLPVHIDAALEGNKLAIRLTQVFLLRNEEVLSSFGKAAKIFDIDKLAKSILTIGYGCGRSLEFLKHVIQNEVETSAPETIF